MRINKSEAYHNSMVEKLKYKPKLIGLEGIALSTGESPLFRKDDAIYREPDGLMFDPSTHTLYNIEYKTNNTSTAYQKAKIQLRTSKQKLQSIFKDWHIRNLYISGNFNIIEVE